MRKGVSMNIWYESRWRFGVQGIHSLIRFIESDEGFFFSTKGKVFLLFQARPCNSERLQYSKDHRGSSFEVSALPSLRYPVLWTAAGRSKLSQINPLLMNNLPAFFWHRMISCEKKIYPLSNNSIDLKSTHYIPMSPFPPPPFPIPHYLLKLWLKVFEIN